MNDEHFEAHLKEHLIDRLGVSMYNQMHHRLRRCGVLEQVLREAVMLEMIWCGDTHDDRSTIIVRNHGNRTQVEVVPENMHDMSE